MKELGDAREVREEPKKTVRNLSSLQGNKKDARLVLKEKMKKQQPQFSAATVACSMSLVN